MECGIRPERYLINHQDPASIKVMSARSYSDAIKALYSLKPHRTTLEILRTSGGWPADFSYALKCLEKIGYKVHPSLRVAFMVILTAVFLSIAARLECTKRSSRSRYERKRLHRCIHRINPPPFPSREENW